jgi:hypothetical protein
MSGRCGILGCGKGRSEGLSRRIELDRILMSFDVLAVPKDIRVLILEALNSDKWDWFTDCDGCTGVSEVYWPTIYFPPCLRHDFDCTPGVSTPRWVANARFYRIQRAYGVSAVRSGLRWLGVTVAWYACLKWKE